MRSQFFNDIANTINEYGWWMVLRSFDITKKSKYWDDVTKESVGGPPYEYKDIILKGRRVEKLGQGDVESVQSRQQLTDVYYVVFYIK